MVIFIYINCLKIERDLHQMFIYEDTIVSNIDYNICSSEIFFCESNVFWY